VLGVAAASPLLLATGCGSSESDAQADSDEQLREDVAAQEAQLIAAYGATIAKFPALSDRLKPFRDQHIEHKQRMVPGESSTPTVTAPTIPDAQPAALRSLRKAERDAASDRVTACEKANAAQLARSLALIAASESQHSTSLTGGS